MNKINNVYIYNQRTPGVICSAGGYATQSQITSIIQIYRSWSATSNIRPQACARQVRWTGEFSYPAPSSPHTAGEGPEGRRHQEHSWHLLGR